VTLKKSLDRYLGAFTMYKLVLALLLALAVLALVESLVGIVSYGPLELAVSALVVVAATMLSSWLFALIFRTRAHLESAAITGLILFFIIDPGLETKDLLGLVAAGAIASASKFVLAFRGRHIFNPAAISALIVTATGIQYASWWVSTPGLLPLVVLAALLILYRTHHVAMGLVFVVVVVALSLVFHPTVPAFAFTAIATVFFAGFMLSEPLTLAPRRWQQVVLAAVAGVLVALPTFQVVGPVYSRPEFALVIVNLLAFLVGQRRDLRLTFLGKTQLTPTTWEFAFQPARPVTFHPGQYLELALPHAKADLRGQRRIFSISSAPTASGPVTLGVKVSERSSSFKTAMLALNEGDTMHATSVGGDFLLPRDTATPVLLVAGGIGITPFASQLAHSANADRDIVVVYSVSAGEELAYRDQLVASGARVIVVAPTKPARFPKGWTYAGASRLDAETLAALVPDVSARHAYVSGPPALVDDLRAILRAVKARRVTTDYFSGY
jgi:glycine betaine catabolism B